jgi:hypothetical protein
MNKLSYIMFIIQVRLEIYKRVYPIYNEWQNTLIRKVCFLKNKFCLTGTCVLQYKEIPTSIGKESHTKA